MILAHALDWAPNKMEDDTIKASRDAELELQPSTMAERAAVPEYWHCRTPYEIVSERKCRCKKLL